MMLKMRKKTRTSAYLPGDPNAIMPERHCSRGSREGRHGRPSVFMYQGEVLQNR